MSWAQRIESESFGADGKWTSFTVTTRDPVGEIHSRAQIRIPANTCFVDIRITEYVGVSHRAKLCDVRLEEPAVRRLYEELGRLLTATENMA